MRVADTGMTLAPMGGTPGAGWLASSAAPLAAARAVFASAIASRRS